MDLKVKNKFGRKMEDDGKSLFIRWKISLYLYIEISLVFLLYIYFFIYIENIFYSHIHSHIEEV